MNVFITPAEFCRRANITKRTLLYYDQMGILKPRLVKSTGARYYSPDQINHLNLISMLNISGTTLKQISLDLTRLNYSFKKLFALYRPDLENHNKELANKTTETFAYFTKSNNILNKFNITFSSPLSICGLKLFCNLRDGLDALDDLPKHFNTTFHNPILFLEFPVNINFDQPTEMHVGLVKEHGVTIKKKYENIIQAMEFNESKSLKQTRLISPAKEYDYLISIVRTFSSSDYSVKRIRILAHNGQNNGKKYIIEAFVLL